MYLDWNATAPMSETVRKRFVWALENCWGNPNSQHQQGRKAQVEVERAREIVAQKLDRVSKQVRFTSGATEANAWLCSHFQKKGKIICSAVEHPSVLKWADVAVGVHQNGILNVEELKKNIERSNVSLVSVMAANNETGVIQPIDEIADICRFYAVPFHTDASQIIGRVEPQITADFITISGHKMGGPKGVGALILNQEITPLFLGGEQERGSRAGTVNAPAIIAMAQAVEEAGSMNNREQLLLDNLIRECNGTIIGEKAPRLPNTTCALFPTEGDIIVMALDMVKIAVSTGSACSSGSSKNSKVLDAMGYVGKPVRFSWGPKDNLQSVLSTIKTTITNLESTCEW